MKYPSCSASIGPHPREVLECLIRRHKYIRTVQILPNPEDLPNIMVVCFLRTIKAAKTIKKLCLKTDPPYYLNTKLQNIRPVLKMHSKAVKVLELPSFPHPYSRLPFSEVKNLRVVIASNKCINNGSLQSQRALESLFMDLRHQSVQNNYLANIISKLPKLQSLSLMSSPALLKKTFELLNHFSEKFYRCMKIKIVTSGNEPYNDLINTSSFATQNVIKLDLQGINTDFLLQTIFAESLFGFPGLKDLKLGLSDPDLQLLPYLKHFRKMESLERLSLFFSECWSDDFSIGVIANLRLPISLKTLKMDTSLSLKGLITQKIDCINNKSLRRDDIEQERNLFEKVPLCISFFGMLENLKNLTKIVFQFQLLEVFRSCYTNFFVSLLDHLHNINFFVLQARDIKNSNVQKGEMTSECFNLAPLLDSCSKINNLKHVEVLMPNLQFENTKLHRNLTQLEAFNVGLSGLKEEVCMKCEYTSNWVQGLLKTLSMNAPNLKSLILDFGELIDERTLCKRFMLIERLQKLETLYMKFFLPKFSAEKVKTVGKSLQCLKRLQTVVLRFKKSDKNVLKIRSYLKYQESLRDVLISCNGTSLINNGYMGSFEDDNK